MNTNIITHETNLGNMRYPFLSDEWTIVNTPLAEAASGSAQPTLRAAPVDQGWAWVIHHCSR